MKMTRLLILSLLVTTVVCRAQPITEPGWFRASLSTNAVPPPPGGSGGSGGAGLLDGGSGPVIAEAITPEIQSLARGLENDPVRIFNYVHDHIRYVLYFGSKKGAQLTLLERSGNDFDQSALLVALLRAAGYTNAGCQFGWMFVPYDSADHRDLHHWLGLSLVNSNWLSTSNYLVGLFAGYRGYPAYYADYDTNTLLFQRVWVKLAIGSTNYYLDPSFKISEPIAGIDLRSAMGFSSNGLMTAAGGTANGNYVQSLSEAGLRDKLRDYTTNLLGYLQNNYPNASVEQILSGQQIVPSTATALSQSLSFPTYEWGGSMPILNWVNQPTNLMSSLAITFAGTNYQWYFPQLQGQRLSLTFDTNALGQLWQDDTLLAQKSASGSASTTNVELRVNHPYGYWDYLNNVFIDTSYADVTNTVAFQRTNSTYALLYAFEPDAGWLQARQSQLDKYRQQGLADTSRQVVTETLNVMGLNWMLQTEWVEQILAAQQGILPQYIHRLGRMGQEAGRGYYVDVYMQLSGEVSNGGSDAANQGREDKHFDLFVNFGSALEHGIIEQLQSSNLVAASTVKMLQLAGTNGQKIFLASSANWTTGANIRSQLTNYNLSSLDTLINANYVLLLSQNGSNNVAGTGSWAGYAYAARRSQNGFVDMKMLIGGGFHGGFSAFPYVTVNPNYTAQISRGQPEYIDFSLFTPGADPVNMVNGAFTVSETDLTLGQSEPRGFTLARHYSPTRRHHNLAGMAHGWVHNYYFNAAEVSAPEAGLGGTTPAQMAPMLVASCSAIGIYNGTQPDPKNWMVTALIAKWGVDQLARNGVSVSLGSDTVQFIKQPDGSFTPPAGNTMTLTKPSSAYNLQERHGNTFKFDSLGRLTNILDQYSQSLTLAYNASNWVQTATDWKGRTLTFTYGGSPQRLTSVADSAGRFVSYGYATTYSTQGDLTAVTDPESKTSTFLYDTNHQIIAAKNALGQTVSSNLYDGFGRVIEQYSQGDTNQTWRLYWSGFVNVEQDPAGGKRRFLYDDKRRLTGLQDALGNLGQSFYDGQDHTVMTVSPLNETNQFIYDGNHNLLRAVDPLGFTNQFVFDSDYNLIRSVDARGNTNRFGYNNKFQLTGSTNGAGDWVTLSYNSANGTLSTRADAGGTTSYGYDSYGHLNAITYPGSLGGESFANNTLGDPTTHTDARGFATTFQYNLRRQLTNSIAPTNLTARVAYDAVGNAASATDARGFSRSNAWSATRKLLATTLPATPQGAPVVTNVYDTRDWLARTLNPLQQATLYTNDAAGRLASVTDPLLRTARLGYDADGRRTAATNAASEATRQSWNARGELTKLTDPATNIVSRVYDAAGNAITLTNRNGKRWQFQFDAANRLTNTITPLSRETRLTYDARGLVSTVREPSAQTATNLYDARGRLTNRADQVGATLYAYDANNNVTSITEAGKTNAWTFDAYNRVASYRDADGNLIQYGHDANGNVTSLVYPGGKTVTYAYDSLNRVTNVTDWASRKTSIEYDLASRVKKITRPNGTVREINYDAGGQTTNIIERTAANTAIAWFKLNWNAAARVEWEFAAPVPHTATPPTRTMTFDDDNRLATFNGSNVTNDLDGNLTWGPLTNTTLTGYTYDARNRLLSVGGTSSVSPHSYGYDPAGHRTSITNGTNITRFVINPNAALSQVLLRVKNGVTNYYVYGVGLLYEADDAGNSRTYHYDYRGSTVALTDGSGTVTDRAEYSAYGTLTHRTGATDTPFLYNGRYGVQTDANGLLYMRSRCYNPYLCRFLNPDPSGFSGGLNFYAYADGNPVSLLDPFGLGAVGVNDAPTWLDKAGTLPGDLAERALWQTLLGAKIGLDAIDRFLTDDHPETRPLKWAALLLLPQARGASAPGRAATTEGIPRITQQGLARVESHLDDVLNNQFGDLSRNTGLKFQAGERGMLERLRSGATSSQDIEFYMHELRESARFRSSGDLMKAHDAALQWRGVTSQDLFHPEVIQANPQIFGSRP